jgi:Bacterial Ig domain
VFGGGDCWGPSAGIRYATFDLLILVGSYMALLCRPTSRGKVRGWDGTPLLVIRAVLVGAICLQVVLGIANGLAGARSWHQSQLLAADFTVNINEIPKAVVSSAFIPGFPADMSYVRQMAQVARTHHLSLFATDLGARYAKEQLPVGLQPVTRVVGLPSGARLKGSQWLHAIASVPVGTITKVEFRLTGGHLRHSLIGNATSTPSGWLDMWNSATVTDGTYTLQSKAFEATGASGYSTGVEVTIDN